MAIFSVEMKTVILYLLEIISSIMNHLKLSSLFIITNFIIQQFSHSLVHQFLNIKFSVKPPEIIIYSASTLLKKTKYQFISTSSHSSKILSSGWLGSSSQGKCVCAHCSKTWFRQLFVLLSNTYYIQLRNASSTAKFYLYLNLSKKSKLLTFFEVVNNFLFQHQVYLFQAISISTTFIIHCL